MGNILKDNLIGEGSACGWMHDFGEYTPFDIDVDSPYEFHNEFPFEWAKVNREAEDETPEGSRIVSFMRSGSTMSPQY